MSRNKGMEAGLGHACTWSAAENTRCSIIYIDGQHHHAAGKASHSPAALALRSSIIHLLPNPNTTNKSRRERESESKYNSS